MLKQVVVNHWASLVRHATRGEDEEQDAVVLAH